MKGKTKSTAIYFIIVAMPTALASINAAASRPPDPGWRSYERNEHTVLDYLRPALRAAKKAGRLYYVVPCNETKGEFPVPFPDVRVRAPSKGTEGLEAVREIFRDDKRVTVLEELDGMIRVNIGRVPAAILQTKIRLLTLKPSEQYNAMQAALAVTGTKEVHAAMRKLGLQEPGTIYSLHPVEPMKGKPHLPAALRDVTVDQALDAVARTFGVLIVFGECTSGSDARYMLLHTVYLEVE